MTQLKQDVPPPFKRHKTLGPGGTPHPDPDGDHNKPTDLLLVTFMGWLWVRRERDVVELTEAKPLSIDRNTKVAEIDGLPGSLGDLVSGGSRGLALRCQIRHDDSAFAGQKTTAPRERERWGKRRSSLCSGSYDQKQQFREKTSCKRRKNASIEKR